MVDPYDFPAVKIVIVLFSYMVLLFVQLIMYIS